MKISKTEDMYNMWFNTWYRIDDMTSVLRCPGGWLYKAIVYDYNKDVESEISTTFVPFNSEGMK